MGGGGAEICREGVGGEGGGGQHFRMGGAMGVDKGWGVSCIFMLKSRSGDMNVCKKKYKSNMIQTDFVNIHDIYDVDKSQLNVTFVKICIC